MKIKSLVENFKNGVMTVERILGKNLTLPILSNVLLCVEKGKITASATNLEIGVTRLIRGKIEKEGKIAVSGKVLGNFLSNISNNERLSIEVKNNTLFVLGGQNRAVIKGVDAKDFPLIPKPQSDYLLELEAPVFQKSALKVVGCAAFSETRQELTGVYFGFEKDSLVMAATDSFRLAESKIRLKKDHQGKDYLKYISKNTSLIVPARTIQEVARSLAAETKKVRVYVGESQIFFEADDTMYVSRLIDGKYPKYKQVVPKGFQSSAVSQREELLRAVRVASIFSDSKSREVKMKVKGDDNRIIIESQSMETGENVTSVAAQISAEGEYQISFNSRYLIDAVNAITTNEVHIGFNDSFGPVIFQEMNDGKTKDDYLYIVMPIRS